MSTAPKITLEQRLFALEQEVARLRAQIEKAEAGPSGWDKVSGAFAYDADFLEAMRLGREWRESLRPKSARTPKKPKRRKS